MMILAWPKGNTGNPGETGLALGSFCGIITLVKVFWIAACFATFLLCSSAVHGLQIAYDGFSYTADATIGGENGGTGWTGAWVTNGTATNYTASTPLAYSAGSVTVTGDTRTALVGSDATDLYARPFAPQTGTLYFSFLFRYDDNGSAGNLENDEFVHFMLNNDAANNISGGIGLLSTSTSFLGVRIGVSNGGGTTVSSPTTMLADTTYLLVGKIWKDGLANYNRVDLFINPSTSVEPGTASATRTESMTVNTISHFTVRGFQIDTNDRYIIDELRIGTTYDSVVVPEPSTAMLILGASGVLLASRRRARA